MLELKQLRQEAYIAWQWLYQAETGYKNKLSLVTALQSESDLPYTDAHFKAEIRRLYGDLRCRTTWEQAAIALTANKISQHYLEPYEIVGYLTSSKYLNCTIRQHYGERLIETLLQIPEVLEMLQDGLEHLYHVSSNAADKEIALKFVTRIARRLFPRSTFSKAA